VLGHSTLGAHAPWIAQEWLPALAADLNDRGIGLLPAVLSGDEAPVRLAGRRCTDLTLNWEHGILSLLHAIR
jgi:hypothetical protein